MKMMFIYILVNDHIVTLLLPLCWTNCFLYANFTLNSNKITSFDFQFGGQTVHVPVKGVS